MKRSAPEPNSSESDANAHDQLPAAGVADVAADPPEDPERRWPRLAYPGAWGAVVFVVLSSTPSLLPRNGPIQGFVSGVSAAIGYGLGVLAAMLWRELADRGPRTPGRRAWRLLVATAVVLAVVALVLGRVWQGRLRTLMGTEDEAWWALVFVPLVGAIVFVALLGAGRGVRRLAEWFAGRLGRWIGRRAARALGWVGVAVLGSLLITGVLLDVLVVAADRAFALRDTGTHEDVVRPTSALRSGGPESLVAWDVLGRQGRAFVGRGPSVAELEDFHGGPAQEPIRAYAGIAAAADTEERAERAVDDLQRAGAFEREHLLVATTTGTGWLDPGSMASFEYVTQGDSAIVALQYSYLPSWISYLVDQPRAREAGRALFDTVYERWVALPADDRPRLYVAGESLGSFGAEAAFSGEADLRTRTDGALFTGPPRFNVLHEEFTDGRDAGSREVEPVFRDGRTVRFSNDIAADAPPRDVPWEGTRVLYVQHPSDPIVWWSTDLLTSRPDWLREAPGRDVLDEMRWIPFVTFWQVTADLPFAVDTPDGHGHRYTSESVDAWVTVIDPPDWTSQDTERLRAIIVE